MDIGAGDSPGVAGVCGDDVDYVEDVGEDEDEDEDARSSTVAEGVLGNRLAALLG